MRERMPLIAFILLVVLLVMLVGFACACLSDHPMQAADRAIASIASAPAIIELWTYTFAALLLVALVGTRQSRAVGPASPADLQRFLF